MDIKIILTNDAIDRNQPDLDENSNAVSNETACHPNMWYLRASKQAFRWKLPLRRLGSKSVPVPTDELSSNMWYLRISDKNDHVPSYLRKSFWKKDTQPEFVEAEAVELSDLYDDFLLEEEEEDEVEVATQVTSKKDKSIEHHRLGQYLLEKGLISKDVLYAASKEQEVTGDRIGQILVRNQYISNKDRIEAVLEVSADRIAGETVSKTLIPVRLLEEHKIIVSTIHDDGIFIATRGDERMVRRIVGDYYPDKKITFVPYSPAKLQPFLSNMRKSSDIDDVDSTQESLLLRLLYRAVNARGSDLHFRPRGKSYAVQMRLNGILQHEHEGPLEELNLLIAQAKGRANLETSMRNKPQFGSFRIEFNQKQLDFRVTTSPTIEGEELVVRIQDPEGINKNLDTLGITQLDDWKKAIKRRGGLCLLTGATNTGKTTTFYSSLLSFDRQKQKIATIENPVEIRISNVTQISVNENAGIGYNEALEVLLTQDPDVIAVGEVRNEKLARLLVRAATSGHMVLATLHTGSISETIDRLVGLGIKDHELRYILRGIISQDLIRQVCNCCKGEGQLANGFSCSECSGSGYIGRMLISEAVYLHDDTDVDKLFAVRDGTLKPFWPTKADDAYLKYTQGLTTAKELDRALGSEISAYFDSKGEAKCPQS